MKKLKKVASECNEEKRNAFINHMAMYDPNELGFLDETLKNKKTAARIYGCSGKGRRAVMKQRFIRGHHLTATALLTVEGIAVSKVVEGSMTRDLYLKFLEQDVVCSLSLSFTMYLLIYCDIASIMHCISRSTECPCNG